MQASPRPLPVITLEPFDPSHADELATAARAVAADTATAFRLWWATPDYSLADAKMFIESAVADREAGTGDAFAVRDRHGALIGCVSAKNIDRLHGCLQGGYWLVPAARRQGYGQASLGALWQWAQDQGLVRMELLIGAGNAASLAAAERIGAQFEGRLRSRFMLHEGRIDVNLMALVKG